MAAQSISTIRARAKGTAQRRVSLALFAGVGLLPLLSMGITVPSAVSKSRAVAKKAEMLQRLDERESIARALRHHGDDVRLDQLDALHTQLLAMIPTRVQALDEFGALRAAADKVGVHLVNVNAVRTHRLSAPAQKEASFEGPQPDGSDNTSGPSPEVAAPEAAEASQGSVLVDEVLIQVREPIDEILGLVDELRRRGLPTVILSFDLTRERPSQSTFQAEVRLGFVRRAQPNLSRPNRP